MATCIVGSVSKEGVWIGGDSASGHSGLTKVSACPKVFERDGLLIGCTSSWRMAQLIQYELHLPVIPRGMTQERLHRWMVTDFIRNLRDCFKQGGYMTVKDGEEWGGTFLIGIEGRLFKVDSDFQVAEHEEDYVACGSGMYFALGAMHATSDPKIKFPGVDEKASKFTREGHRIRLALEAAAHLDPFVRPPFVIGLHRQEKSGGKNTVMWY